MISSGELRPGQRLPREPDLAANLGLSRSSLREAVKALATVRVLEVRQGDGTYVSDLSAESLVETLSFIVEFQHDSSVLELLEVRRILEPVAVARAATRISDEGLTELERVLEQVSADSPVAELVEADMQFHRLITWACGNSVLASLIQSLSGPTQRARLWRGMTQVGALERTLAEHRDIFDALRAHDPELAWMRAAIHVAGVEDWLRSTLERPGPDGADAVGPKPRGPKAGGAKAGSRAEQPGNYGHRGRGPAVALLARGWPAKN
jgi:GntR family transcriptional repressor for pyruvate dehydrogenase complex